MTLAATVTVVAETGAEDEYGNPTEQTTTTATTCWLHQTQRSEGTVDANTQDETWQLYLPPTVTIDGGDRITVQGVIYELIGPPWRAFNPRLETTTHIEATVRRVV